MKYNRFSGDPAVSITPDGAKMSFIGGQPVMDQGLENAAQISLFTKKKYWGNILETEESKKIGSDFQAQCMEPITELKSINAVTDAANKALKWMLDIKLANEITVTVTNPRTDNLTTKIIITPPGRDSKTLLFLKNGLNWISQAVNPAHERMK